MKKTLLCLLTLCFSSLLFGQDFRKQKIQDFVNETGADISVQKTAETPRFIRFKRGKTLKLSGNSLLQKTNSFLQKYGDIYGIKDLENELIYDTESTDNIGTIHLTKIQHYNNIPVYDGVLNFHFNPERELTGVNGNFFPEIKLNTNPSVGKDKAAYIALQEITRQTGGTHQAPLYVQKNNLLIFNPGLAKGEVGTYRLVYEIEVRNDLDVRDFLFVDAHEGKVIEHYPGMCHALFRRLYENNTGNQIWQEGNAFPGTLDQWQQNEIETAGHSYHFFNNAFSWTSYDNADAEMRTINNDPNISCPNANWNGSTANYCTGTAADDVVAHEWGHAYTEYTNGLIYYGQSGALNESLSDIWGETIDLLNGYEDAGEDNSVRSGTGCNESNRWKMGEDASAFGGAIRDMWVPTCNGDPGKVTDSQYHCLSSDAYGVHINSGIPNHCYALMVDGGTYNGQTVSALGFTKAAHIVFRAQTTYLTKTSNFAVFADALKMACADLVGVNLEGLSTTGTPAGPSGEIITTADCLEVEKAIMAVQLETEPGCGFAPLLASVSPICGGASTYDNIFSEDWESGLGSWTVSQVPTNPGTWTSRDWAISTSLPDGRAGQGIFGTDPAVGDCSADLENGIIRLQSPTISIPGTAIGPILMTFDHYVSMEDEWDGGNIKYSRNGGTWTLLPSSAFTANPYNKNLNTAGAGNDNPLAGQASYTGADEGGVTGTWGQSQIDLSSISVVPGDNIQFRWEVGSDGCNGWDGWYLDDILIYSCTAPTTTPDANITTTATTAEQEGTHCDVRSLTFEITMANPPTANANVTWAFSGTAINGVDYTVVGGTAHTFTTANWSTPHTVTLDIERDGIVEGDETIVIDITGASGGGSAVGTSNQLVFTLVNDDFAPSTGSSGNYTVGAGGTSTETFYSPFRGFYEDERMQLIYPAAELTAMGATAGDITAIAFNIVTKQSTQPYSGFNINMGTTTDVAFGGATYYTGLTNVYTSAVTTTTGWNTFTLDTPFTWDGISSVIVEVCWDNTSWTDSDIVAYDDVGYTSVSYNRADGATGCTLGTNFTTGNRAQTRFTIIGGTEIQTVTNTASGYAEHDLGPNQTVHFYDQVTGNIMLSIQELSGHDYGCTRVEVDRQGVDDTGWILGYNVTNKTFKVTPENNNPSGSYSITLYYEASEIPVFLPSITSMVKGAIEINNGTNNASNSFAEADGQATFGSDYQFTATFNSGFSGFALSDAPPIPFPVELLSFTATPEERSVQLDWVTVSETDNKGFEVERSLLPNSGFRQIGFVEGNGTSADRSEYQFVDGDVSTGVTYYYRLKQVDFDGGFEYTSIISAKLTGRGLDITLMPNPAKDFVEILVHNAEGRDVEINVFNTQGQLVINRIVNINENNTININTSNLPKGIYMLEVDTRIGQLIKKLVIE